MRTCEHCKNQHSGPYIKYCKTCYFGIKCKGASYIRRKLKRELINTSCEKCGRIRLKESDVQNTLCRWCYQKKRYEKNPEFHEKHKKLCRDLRRRERGIDTELPLLNAPAGSGYISPNGYKKICKKELRGHPNADSKGKMFEHTYVMSQHLGRALFKGETIHHKNGIRHDNRLENLELRSSHHGPGQSIEDKIKWCKEFLEIYGYKVSK